MTYEGARPLTKAEQRENLLDDIQEHLPDLTRVQVHNIFRKVSFTDLTVLEKAISNALRDAWYNG